MPVEPRQQNPDLSLSTSSADAQVQQQHSAAPPPSPSYSTLSRSTSAGSSVVRRHSATTSSVGDAYGRDLYGSAASSVTAPSTGLLFPTSPSVGPSSQFNSPGNLSSLDGESRPCVALKPPATISFVKDNQAFKLAYIRMKVYHTASGGVRQIELSGSDPDGFVDSSFVHTFPGTETPVPHIEHPLTAASNPPFVVSFLETQVVRASGVVFSSQPHYTFDNWEDCVRFQETILNQHLVFTAGMSRAKSKGRGEESISQNLRIWQTSSGRQILFFFANSQRKGSKRYVFVPREGIDSLKLKKGCVTLSLDPNVSELLRTLAKLELDFLDPLDAKLLCDMLDLKR